MKKTAIVVLSLVMLVGAGSAAMAGSRNKQFKRGFANQPQLTTEQQTKLQEYRAAFMQDTLALRQSLVNKAQELRTLMLQKDYDQEQAKALSYELVDIRAQLAKKAIDHAITVKKDLGVDLPMGRFGQFGNVDGRRGFRGHRGVQCGYGPGNGNFGPGHGRMGAGNGYGQGPGMMYRMGDGSGYGAGPGMMYRMGDGSGCAAGPGMMYRMGGGTW